MKFCLDCKVHTIMMGKIVIIYDNLPALMVYCTHCGRRQFGELICDWTKKIDYKRFLINV